MQAFKCFIIRLEENDHSCQMAAECKKQASKFGIEAEYFKAINGLDVEQHYIETQVPRPKKKFKKGKPGVLGCFFSHYYLWKMCAEQTEPYCILEHDGYFIKPLTKKIIDSFDDVLKLDNNDPYSSKYNKTIEDEMNYDVQIKKYINPAPKALHKIGTGNYFKGAYSYVIKPSGAKKLLDFIHLNENGLGHRPADQQIGDGILNTWVTIPTIARLHPFYSEGTNLKTASLTGNPELL